MNAKSGEKIPVHSLAGAAFVLLACVSSTWVVRSAMAADPVLNLKLTGPQTTKASTSFAETSIHVNNTGPATQNARLRLMIHDGADRSNLKTGSRRKVRPDDIEVTLQEGASWVSKQLASFLFVKLNTADVGGLSPGHSWNSA